MMDASSLATVAESGWIPLFFRGAAIVVGLSLLWAAIMAAVGVMLVPRPSNQRLALWVGRACHLVFRLIVRRAKDYVQLDRLLAVQGPTTVLIYLALFLLILVGAFAFLFYGVTGCPPSEAFLRSGSSMSTLGVVEASGFVALTVMFASAFIGTTVISVFIGFLLTLYTAYTARETFMSKVAMVCGEPGWGPEMVVRMRNLQLETEQGSVGKCIDWICAMRVSQYIYPLLNHFRSPVRDRHWAITLLATLDAAAIRLTAIDKEVDMNLVLILSQGAETFRSLKASEIARTAGGESEGTMLTWMIEEKILAAKQDGPLPDPGISRADWDRAMEFLISCGIELQPDRDSSWRAFCRVRTHYAEPAYFLTSHLGAIRAPWSGPRHPSFDFPVVWPLMARKVFDKGADGA